MKFNNKELKEYDIENWNVRETINAVVKELSDLNLIDFKWKKYEEENIIDSAWLILDSLNKAYEEVNRKPMADDICDAIDKLKLLKKTINTRWIIDFVDSCADELLQKKKFTKYIPENHEIFSLVLKALYGIDKKGEDDMLERIFSRKFLGGSKVFEKKVRSRIITIIKDFILSKEELEDEEVLETVGIIKTSEDLLFHGSVIINLNGNVIDFRKFIYGAFMNTNMIKNFTIDSLQVSKVITIENKANYLYYIKNVKDDNSLIIYLAGFYSHIKSIFIEKLYNYLKNKNINAEFYHWGDIDLGGFRIFVKLRSIIRELKPLYMNTETLKNNYKYCDVMDDKYCAKLIKLKNDENYKEFFDVIDYMVGKKVKLEQEALIL